MSRTYLIIFGLLIVILSCTPEKKPVSRPSSIPVREFGGNFSLKSKDGDWKLFSTNGKVRVIYFGFTFCPDICPMALGKLSKTLKQLSPKKRDQVLPVFISVDYKRDNAETVGEYVEYFAPDFVGLAGSKEQIDKVTKQYGAFYKFVKLENSALEYTVDHMSRFFLIKKSGEFYKSYTNIETDSEFMNDLKELTGD